MHNALLIELTVGLEHAEDLGASDGADLGNAVGVTQDHTDLQKQEQKKGETKTRNIRSVGQREDRLV